MSVEGLCGVFIPGWVGAGIPFQDSLLSGYACASNLLVYTSALLLLVRGNYEV